MKKIFFLSLILTVLSSCAPQILSTLKWQSNKVITDGKIDEWDNPLRFYDYKSKLNYTFSNDKNNLYVCMKIADEITKQKILKGGLIFSIDTAGKKEYATKFMYPQANQAVTTGFGKDENMNENKKFEHSAIKQKLLGQAKEAQLVGFKQPLGGIITFPDQSGISAAINIDSLRIMYYEAIIPFRTFYKNELSSADTNLIFNFRIQISGLPAASMHNDENKNDRIPNMNNTPGNLGALGGAGMHGGGGHGGGGHGGGHHSSTGGEHPELYEKNTISTKLRLAVVK